MIETGKQFTQHTNSGVSERGMEEVSKRLTEIIGRGLPSWFSNDWECEQDLEIYGFVKIVPINGYNRTIGHKLRGKFAKRIAQWCKLIEADISKEEVEEVAQLAATFNGDADSLFVYDFTQSFDWHDGDFGDGGSCYWNEYSGTRITLQENGFYAMRAYSPGSRGYGIGRCWMCQLSPTEYIIFNAYFKNSYIREYQRDGHGLKLFARMLASHLGYDYIKSIGLCNYGDWDSAFYINDGAGYIISKDKSDLDYYDFEMHVEQYYCDSCEEYVSCETTEVADGGYVCDYCLDRYYSMCEECDQYEYYECTHTVYSHERGNYIICEYCWQNMAKEKCENCEETVPAEQIKNNKNGLCDSCDDYARCTECGHIDHPEDMEFSRIEDAYVCYDCAEKYYKECEQCGDLVFRSELDQGICPPCYESETTCSLCNSVFLLKNCNIYETDRRIVVCEHCSEGVHICVSCKYLDYSHSFEDGACPACGNYQAALFPLMVEYIINGEKMHQAAQPHC